MTRLMLNSPQSCALWRKLYQREAGKTKRLSRTRQKLSVSVRQTLADLALKPQPSSGFLKLVEFGMADMSAEALILKYRSEFEPEVVASAQARLEKHGIPIPDE